LHVPCWWSVITIWIDSINYLQKAQSLHTHLQSKKWLPLCKIMEYNTYAHDSFDMSYVMGSTKMVISKLIKMVQSSCLPHLADPFKTYFKKWYTGIPWYTSSKHLHVLAYCLVKTRLVIYGTAISLYIHTIISNALLTILKASFTELFNGSIIHNS